MRFRASGNPPIEAGIINEHHGIGPLMAKIPIGPTSQRKNL